MSVQSRIKRLEERVKETQEEYGIYDFFLIKQWFKDHPDGSEDHTAPLRERRHIMDIRARGGLEAIERWVKEEQERNEERHRRVWARWYVLEGRPEPVKSLLQDPRFITLVEDFKKNGIPDDIGPAYPGAR